MKRQHREPPVGKEAMDLVVEVYRLCASFPRQEAFTLTAQARRAAICVPSNLAEGAIAKRLGYCSNAEELLHRLDSVSRQFVAMRSKLRSRASS